MSRNRTVLVGTCGFPKAHARCYEALDVVEVQQTFYEPPGPETLARWRSEAPRGFQFTMKAFQAITHSPESPTYRRSKLSPEERQGAGCFRDTSTVWRAWERTLECARALEAAVIVFQCPARFRPGPENVRNMRNFFERVDRGGFRFAWEPRGDAWTDELILELCEELDLLHVVDPFVHRPVRGGTHYYRLHGRTGYRYRYTDEDLQELATFCTARTTYCLFNNVSMWEDAVRFRDRLHGQQQGAATGNRGRRRTKQR